MHKKGVVIPFFDYNSSNAIESDTVSSENEMGITREKESFEETLTRHDEFFVNMSHELKTPLNVIFSAIQLMEMSLTNDEKGENRSIVLNSIFSIKQNCYRLTKLINNIIDLSKIDAGNLKLNISDVNIVELIENIVQISSRYIKVKNLKIIFDTNVEKKVIACDYEKIERIVLNLISNAVKFSHDRGTIFVNVLDKGDSVEVSVKDNGIGIDEQSLANIFNRFGIVDKSLSRVAEGSGMGLSLVKSMVELHGGTVSVQSKPGLGSIFKFEIPSKISFKQGNNDKMLNQEEETMRIEFSDI